MAENVAATQGVDKQVAGHEPGADGIGGCNTRSAPTATFLSPFRPKAPVDVPFQTGARSTRKAAGATEENRPLRGYLLPPQGTDDSYPRFCFGGQAPSRLEPAHDGAFWDSNLSRRGQGSGDSLRHFRTGTNFSSAKRHGPCP